MKHIARILVGWLVIFIFLSIILMDTEPVDYMFSEDYGPWESGFVNGFSNALGVVFFSIICTAGFGLIFWLALGSGVGWIVFKIFGWDKGKATEEEPIIKFLFGVPNDSKEATLLTNHLNQELHNDPALNRNQSALVNYIKKAKEKGLTNEQISLNLQNNGWPADNINWAINALG